MADPVVHFEINGKNPDQLRNYFGELFGWQFDTSSSVAEAVSEPTDYGFVGRSTTPDGTGIPGGIGGGASYQAHVIFYVGVPSVEAALAEAERLGGKRRLGPERAPTGLVIGHFTDPEGNLIGVAGAELAEPGPAGPARRRIRFQPTLAGAVAPNTKVSISTITASGFRYSWLGIMMIVSSTTSSAP